MKEIFTYKKLPYNLRNSNGTNVPTARTSEFGTENIRLIGQKVRQKLPDELRYSPTLNIFKTTIKQTKLDYSCRLCKKYILNLGYI